MKIKIALTGIFSVMLMLSCTDDFVETNTNPAAVAIAPAGALFNPIVQNPLRNYQRNINLYPDLFSQYWGNIISGFESGRYEYVDGWIGNMWREFYTDTLAEANTMVTLYGDDPAFTDALAQLEIWMVSEWARMLQIYGDLPYFGAGEGVLVPYSSEEEIYTDLFARLDAAVNVLGTSDVTQFSYGGDDLIYNGDSERWRVFGNSLRLRLAMRLANVAPQMAREQANAAVNLGVMVSNDDICQIPLWGEGGFYDYIHIISNIFINIRISETFADLMYSEAGFEDPRASRLLAYDEDSPLNGGDFMGVANGLDVVPEEAVQFATMKTEDLGGEFVGFVGNRGTIGLFMPIMTYSEVLFLQAEAALRGWIPGDANSLYTQGVQASMDFVGVPAAEAADYIAAIPTLSGSNEAQLKQLITQKYIANFPNGSEAWADFRRTDYPDITLPADGVSGNSLVAPETWVKRVRYPDAAHNFESEFMPAEFNTIPTNRMDIRLWWDTADTSTKTNGLMNSNF